MSIAQKALRPSLSVLSCRYYNTTSPPAFRQHNTPPVSEDLSKFIDEITDNSVSARPPTPPPGGYGPPKVPNPLELSSLKTKQVHHLHVNASPNNTILTFTGENGAPIGWYSGGKCGFKGVNRSGYEAGYQCTVRMFDMVAKRAKEKSLTLEIIFKGFGQGREAFFNALKTSEGEEIRPLVTRMSDRTPIKIGGTRAKKARRL